MENDGCEEKIGHKTNPAVCAEERMIGIMRWRETAGSISLVSKRRHEKSHKRRDREADAVRKREEDQKKRERLEDEGDKDRGREQG